MGFFLDYVFTAIVRFARRELRLRQTLKWPIVVATVHSAQMARGFSQKLYPVLGYSFVVNGESQYGSVRGMEIEQDPIDEVVEELKTLQVRYNPADPYVSRVLSTDNPKLPFAIDQEHP
jgi:hypothetical protein